MVRTEQTSFSGRVEKRHSGRKTTEELNSVHSANGDLVGTVVKVLCYKSQGRWFDSSWSLEIFIDIKYFRSHYGPRVDSASNRNEYQENFLRVKTAGV